MSFLETHYKTLRKQLSSQESSVKSQQNQTQKSNPVISPPPSKLFSVHEEKE